MLIFQYLMYVIFRTAGLIMFFFAQPSMRKITREGEIKASNINNIGREALEITQ